MSLLCEYPDFIYLAYCVDKKPALILKNNFLLVV